MKSTTTTKYLVFLLVFVMNSFSLLAQVPINDNCSNAINIGTLPIPGICTTGLQDGLPTIINNQTTFGASAENPYNYLINCEGTGADMVFPALDTWYSFVASGNRVNITVSNFSGVNIGLWEGTNCNTLVGRGCSKDSALSMYQTLVGQTYYIQISGNSFTDVDTNFTLSVDNDIDCSDCLINSSITCNPSPTNGTFAPGQAVTFCFNINGYMHVNTNWLHGVQISYGSGWSGISNQTAAASCSTVGTWGWYNSCTSTNTSLTLGPGFYYNNISPADGNPGNNLGDNCSETAANWTFCFTLTVASSFSPGSNLSVAINTSGDSESGSWSNIGCTSDSPLLFNAVGTCGTSAGPDVTICGNQNTILNGFGGSSYTWIAIAGDPIVVGTNFSCDTCALVTAKPAITTTYVLQSTNVSFCNNTDTVKVIVAPNFNPNVTVSDDSVCVGQAALLNTTIGLPGTYTYGWQPTTNLSSATVSNPSAIFTSTGLKKYIVSVTSVFGCTKKDSIDIMVLTKPTAVITPQNDSVCRSRKMLLDVSVSPVATYSYLWYPSAELNSSSNSSVEFQSQNEGLHYLYAIATDVYGCKDTSSTALMVYSCDIVTYNGFTPNNDTHNDTWFIDHIEIYPDNEVTILNKWGQIVWDTKGYNNNDKVWAGKNKNGDVLPDATYFFMINADGKTIKGRVELIR